MKMLEDLEEVVRLIDGTETTIFGAADAIDFIRTHHATIRDMAERLEAAERDAARYRWLRDIAWSLPAISQQELPAVAVFSGSGRRCKDISGEEMDRAIDDAMKLEPTHG